MFFYKQKTQRFFLRLNMFILSFLKKPWILDFPPAFIDWYSQQAYSDILFWKRCLGYRSSCHIHQLVFAISIIMSFSLTGYIVRDEAVLAHMHLLVFVSINLVISYFTKPSLVLALIYHVHHFHFQPFLFFLLLLRKKNFCTICVEQNITQKPFWNGVSGLHDSSCKTFLALFPFLSIFFVFSCWCSSHIGFFVIHQPHTLRRDLVHKSIHVSVFPSDTCGFFCFHCWIQYRNIQCPVFSTHRFFLDNFTITWCPTCWNVILSLLT